LASGATGAPAAPVPVPVLVDWDGAIGAEACVPTGPGSCGGAGAPPAGGKQDVFQVSAAQARWTGTVTLEWQATTATTQELRLHFGFWKSCGASCWESVGDFQGAEGPSPLTLAVDGAVAPADAEGLYLSVSTPSLTPAPVLAVAEPGQEFHAEGRLDASPTPPA
jgi:hypothetical protein